MAWVAWVGKTARPYRELGGKDTNQTQRAKERERETTSRLAANRRLAPPLYCCRFFFCCFFPFFNSPYVLLLFRRRRRRRRSWPREAFVLHARLALNQQAFMLG